MHGLRKITAIAAAAMAAAAMAPGAASADYTEPETFTPPGYDFCGWKNYEYGGWDMEWDDSLQGISLIAYADGMSCQAARRNVRRVHYVRVGNSYRPARSGYRCVQLTQALEYSDVRCTKVGGSRKFRFQSGA